MLSLSYIVIFVYKSDDKLGDISKYIYLNVWCSMIKIGVLCLFCDKSLVYLLCFLNVSLRSTNEPNAIFENHIYKTQTIIINY